MKTFIDLFSGAGIFTLSAKFAGCVPVGAVDIEKDACASYQANHALKPICADIHNVDFTQWRGADGIIASPPCVTFSAAARGFNRDSDLPLEVARAVETIQPEWVVVENVVPFRRYPSYSVLRERLNNVGYLLYENILNAADFGVPQKRRRLFLVASRNPLPNFSFERKQWVPVSTILEDLPLTQAPFSAQMARWVAAINADRFLLFKYGFERENGHWQPYDKPLYTATTEVGKVAVIDKRRGWRRLTITEIKRAMGVPDDYILVGSRTSQTRQLGNAVVPAVASAVVAYAVRLKES